jgi:RNA polymerase sigma factor (sigma-70 family)
LTDKELIEGCLKGRKRAQDELYGKYSGRLFGVCLRYTRDRMEAEDVLQEGFVRIFKKMELFKSGEDKSVYPWMKRVVVNVTLNYLRDNKRHRFTEDVDSYSEKLVDEQHTGDISDMFENISPEKILDIIRQLPDGYRTVFNLYAFEGFGHNEIADALGISVSTSKTQLMKARRVIVSRLQQKTKSQTVLKLVI